MRLPVIIEAPSPLGVAPHGIEKGGDALLQAGLAERIGAEFGARIEPAPFDWQRDPDDGFLNKQAISDYAGELASAVGAVLDRGAFPIVLGGDCSIMLGTLLALQPRGRFGLLFLDGHMDFYQPEAEPHGEAASMELALATGRGPDLVSRVGGSLPLVRDDDIVVFGFRDEEEAFEHGSQPLPPSIVAFSEKALRQEGFWPSVEKALALLCRPDLDGFWLHLDVDVLSHEVLPAADFPQTGGLQWDELQPVLVAALGTGRVAGMEITIFNATLDKDGMQAEALTAFLTDAVEAARRVGSK